LSRLQRSGKWTDRRPGVSCSTMQLVVKRRDEIFCRQRHVSDLSAISTFFLAIFLFEYCEDIFIEARNNVDIFLSDEILREKNGFAKV